MARSELSRQSVACVQQWPGKRLFFGVNHGIPARSVKIREPRASLIPGSAAERWTTGAVGLALRFLSPLRLRAGCAVARLRYVLAWFSLSRAWYRFPPPRPSMLSPTLRTPPPSRDRWPMHCCRPMPPAARSLLTLGLAGQTIVVGNTSFTSLIVNAAAPITIDGSGRRDWSSAATTATACSLSNLGFWTSET